jgi:hypothetical protein
MVFSCQELSRVAQWKDRMPLTLTEVHGSNPGETRSSCDREGDPHSSSSSAFALYIERFAYYCGFYFVPYRSSNSDFGYIEEGIPITALTFLHGGLLPNQCPTRSTPDLSRQHHLHIFSQKQNANAEIFGERLFMSLNHLFFKFGCLLQNILPKI